ncbi:MAG TPA: glucosaminidase domain-containing protein, partial [Chitinophagales bacterium]|nr:glucosaminidase domain-containing protein [Chitinophagales bacterium]
MKKIILLTTYCFLLTTFSYAQDVAVVKAYIEKYKTIAIAEMNRVGIPASITLAQGLHESGNGNSFLAKNTNNHFGIKCHETWTGKTFSYTDDAPDECFRVYDKVEDSYVDHSDFLRNRPRYAFLFLYEKNDYKKWAYGLKKAGYATNPKYPEILIKIIEENQLFNFDNGNEELATDKKEDVIIDFETKENPLVIPDISVPKQPTQEQQEEVEAIDKNIKKPMLSKPIKKTILSVNKCDAVKIAKGETIEQLANYFNLETEDLLAFNDVADDSKFKPGQYLFIEKKKKSNKEKTYTFKSTDNIWLVSQNKGVQLNELLKRNKLEDDEEPVAKTVIYLKGKAKEKPALRPKVSPKIEDKKDAIAIKSIETKPSIVRANDTIYPPIKEVIKNIIDSNKILSFESDTKLLENNYSVQTPINTDKDTIVKIQTPPIQTISNPDLGRSVSVYE